jgi:hypothetical protein
MAKVATKKFAGDVLVVSFSDGAVLECDSAKLSESIRHRLMLHGLSQKVGDSYASADSIAEARANAETIWTGLERAEWGTRIAGGSLAEALARATGKPVLDCIRVLGGMDDKQKRDLRKHPGVLKALAEIEAERAEGSNAESLDKLF